MSNALRDMYTIEFLQEFGKRVKTVYNDFDVEQFSASVIDTAWDDLPLKARILQIAETLGHFLPKDFTKALNILFAIDENCIGFPYLFFPNFVEVYGQKEEYWELSMTALERFTQRSSSEFAIRPFLLRDPERVMERMLSWAQHPNEHVRRLSSEGCRPRLPWGISLPIYKYNPQPVLAVLNYLKADSSLYVRKSVANNLNDIAKDNPDMVLRLARQWIGTNPNTDWILRQGCRTLIRKANPEAMELFGYVNFSESKTSYGNAILSIQPTELKIGEVCELQYSIDIIGKQPAHIRLEYGIDFIKSNGKSSRKLFLLTDKIVQGSTHLVGTRKHSFADLSTRRHYSGTHRIVLLINGEEAAQTEINILG
ncbi:MAG: putative alkylation repair enzyme [Herbinix sp.]|nr:putative alkylation repair enzyme [Herbinix sp.]